MRFNLLTTKYATLLQPNKYNHQFRTYNRFQHYNHNHSQVTQRTQLFKNPSNILPNLAISRKFYSSKTGDNSKMGLLSWYLGLLESRPILTKSISSAIIYGIADITSQMITMESYDTWDKIRTLRMAGFGLIILGPSQHVWFNFVGRVLPKRDVITTFKKLAMGQLMFGPLINGSFFSFNAALQGESGEEIAARLKRDLIPTLMNGLMFWPMCDFLTYKIIPVHLQPLINSSFSYLWSIYLTYMASLKKVGAD